MRLTLASAGSYPRIGDTPDAQRHRRAYASRERGELSEAEWHAVEDEVTREIIGEQIAAGVELPTDGQVRWYDPISHLCRPLAHVTINGLLRYFDTNFYFRQPVVAGPIARREPILLREFEMACRAAAPHPVKPVLTGPYSLAQASILASGFGDQQALTHAYAEVLAAEIADLARAGAEVIQVDEPFLLKRPQDVELVRLAFVTLAAARGRARLACYTYFGDAVGVYDGLQALPVDVLGFDFTYSPKLARRIVEAGTDKTLALGLIDGRNTKLETEETLYPVLDQLLPRLRGTAYLGPSCGLEFLPRERARAKLERMSALARGYVGRRRT
jgi:5-methyltetrahydropteroyltriglutamate--homocysteine methyltransferase